MLLFLASALGAPFTGLKFTDVALWKEQPPRVRLRAKCLVSSDGTMAQPLPAWRFQLIWEAEGGKQAGW